MLFGAGEGLQPAVVEVSMAVELVFAGDVDERAELHDLSLVPLMCFSVALQLVLLPAEEFSLGPGLFQQVSVVILQSAVSVLNERDLGVRAPERRGGLGVLERSGIVDRVAGEIGGGLWIAPADA